MGPNYYITVPHAFTALHEDGHGTVDSMHCCLGGHNEVVMVRRMNESYKKHVYEILTNGMEDGNSMHHLPHNEEVRFRVKKSCHFMPIIDIAFCPNNRESEKQVGQQMLHLRNARRSGMFGFDTTCHIVICVLSCALF